MYEISTALSVFGFVRICPIDEHALKSWLTYTLHPFMLSQTAVISTVNSIANSLIVLLFINFPFCDIFCLHKMRYNRHIADCDIFALQMRYDINPYLSCRKAHIAPKVYRIVRYIANPPGFISPCYLFLIIFCSRYWCYKLSANCTTITIKILIYFSI